MDQVDHVEDRFVRKRITELTDEEFGAWLDLTRQNPDFASPFFSPFFARAVAGSRDDCRVVLVHGERGLVGFFPYQFRSRFWGHAVRIGGHLSDYDGILLTEPRTDPAFYARLLRAAGIHQYDFNHLHAGQAPLGFCRDFVREGCVLRGDPFAAYLTALEQSNKKLVADTRRRRKKLEKEIGPVEWHADTASLDDLRALVALKRDQYARTGAGDVFAEQWTRQTLERLLAIRRPEFSALLSKLTVRGEPVAYHFGILANGILHFWFPVYNDDYAKYGPGRLLFFDLLASADELGIRTIDRGEGVRQHKKDFDVIAYPLGVGSLRRPGLKSGWIRVGQFLQARRERIAAKRAP